MECVRVEGGGGDVVLEVVKETRDGRISGGGSEDRERGHSEPLSWRDMVYVCVRVWL